MRKPEALLLDIDLAAKRLASYIHGMTREEFLHDDKTKAAVVREIAIIGEAAGLLSAEFRSAHPDVPWSDLARLRNIFVHVYHRIKYDRVWITATRTIPATAAAVSRLAPTQPDASGDASFGQPSGDT